MKLGCVYLICDPVNDHYKIGVTKNDESERLKRLQTGNSNEMFVHTIYKTKWPFRIETLLHKKYSSKKVLNEWFELSPEEVLEFKDVCGKLEKQIESVLDNPFILKSLR